MTKKVCGNCDHFTHEPNTPSRGVCWYSTEFDYYVVRGEKWAGCDDWEERVTPEIVRCKDCKHYDADAGFCLRFKAVSDYHYDLEWQYQVAEWGYLECTPDDCCSFGKRREDA